MGPSLSCTRPFRFRRTVTRIEDIVHSNQPDFNLIDREMIDLHCPDENQERQKKRTGRMSGVHRFVNETLFGKRTHYPPQHPDGRRMEISIQPALIAEAMEQQSEYDNSSSVSDSTDTDFSTSSSEAYQMGPRPYDRDVRRRMGIYIPREVFLQAAEEARTQQSDSSSSVSGTRIDYEFFRELGEAYYPQTSNSSATSESNEFNSDSSASNEPRQNLNI